MTSKFTHRFSYLSHFACGGKIITKKGPVIQKVQLQYLMAKLLITAQHPIWFNRFDEQNN